MGRIEELIPKIEITEMQTNTGRIVEPQVRKYYQKNGIWYAVVSICIRGFETKMHVVLT